MALTEAERISLLLKIRWAQDPCRQMKLTPTQRSVDECNSRYIAVRGQNRGGKTAFSAKKLSSVARRLPDNKTTSVRGVYIVFAPSRSQLSDPWGKKLLKGSELQGALFEKPFLPEYEIASVRYTYGAGEPTINLIELKNGNQILFCVSGDKNVWKRVEGKGMILGIVFDESAGTEQLLEEAMTRLLDANSNPTVRAEAGGGWIIWGATQTKNTAAFERFLALGESDDPLHHEYAAFTLKPDENPAIDMAERRKMAVVMSEESYNIRMLGHGSAASYMAVWPQWDDSVNLTAKGQDYAIQDDDNLWIGYDPGTHYTGIVLAAINKRFPRRLNIVKCWQPQRTLIEQDVRAVRDYLGGRSLEGFVYDQAARKIEKVGTSVVGELDRIMRQAGTDIKIHRGMMKGRSEYQSTIPLMRRYLICPTDSPDHPTNIILNRDPGTGCGILKHQIQQQTFTDNDYELKESNIKSGNDHILDGTRYLISREPAWVKRPCGPKLWGEGAAGKDPDADKLFDRRSLSHEAALNGGVSEIGARRARAKMKRFRNAGQW